MSGCSACVFDAQSGQAFVRSEDMPRGQAQHLIPMVEDVMGQAGCGYEALEAIVTTNGPGAFTGLRIGLSSAKAFAQALAIPVFGITTLQALALAYAPDAGGEFCVLVETRREEFYAQRFGADGAALEDARLARAEEIAPDGVVFIGDGAARFKGLNAAAETIEGFELPDPEVMARSLATNPALFSENPAALYLRGADVSASKRSQRRIA